MARIVVDVKPQQDIDGHLPEMDCSPHRPDFTPLAANTGKSARSPVNLTYLSDTHDGHGGLLTH